jgi:hypothetical protein
MRPATAVSMKKGMGRMSANSRLTSATNALTWIGLYERYSHRLATSEQVTTVVAPTLLPSGACSRSCEGGLIESRRGGRSGRRFANSDRSACWTSTRPWSPVRLLCAAPRRISRAWSASDPAGTAGKLRRGRRRTARRPRGHSCNSTGSFRDGEDPSRMEKTWDS